MVQRLPAAVLGLGRFGSTVAIELARLGYEVLAVDNNEVIIQEIAEHITQAIQADITNREVLEELGLAHFDIVVIGTSGSLETSILATVAAKQLGVQRIVVKAGNELHGSILEKVGATRIVYPEHETGIRLAHSIAAPGVDDYLAIAAGFGIARVAVNEQFMNRSLKELNLSNTCGVSVIAVHRRGTVTLNPSDSEVLHVGDELIVAGLDENLAKLPGSGKDVSYLPPLK